VTPVLSQPYPPSTIKEERHVGKVVAGATVSLDGYIAGPNESGFEHLFAWFAGGDVEFPSVNPEFKVRLSEPDYRYMRDFVERIGVFVIGRRMFDLSDGWGGRHAFDKPIVVVTHSVPEPWVAAHPDAPFTFVTDGLPEAIEGARAIAGDRNVCVTPGKLASQCLALGLLDEIWIDLVPVLLGFGVRLFDELKAAPILLDGPDLLVEGSRVTHLRYQVRRS
jgi:dihydrofolate reductase